MRLHVKLIRLLFFLCVFLLIVVFILNWTNETGVLHLPEFLSFGFLNTVAGGILASAFVVLLSEMVTYYHLKRETLLTVFLAYQAEYSYYRLVAQYIEQNMSNKSFWTKPIDKYSDKIFDMDCSIRDIDYCHLVRTNDSYYKIFKDSKVTIGANASVFAKFSKQIVKYIDVQNTIFSECGILYTPTAPIRDPLQNIKKIAESSSEDINRYINKLDNKKTNFHWAERKESIDSLPINI